MYRGDQPVDVGVVSVVVVAACKCREAERGKQRAEHVDFFHGCPVLSILLLLSQDKTPAVGKYCAETENFSWLCSISAVLLFIRVNSAMQMEERTLAEGCRNGDGAAQRELYDRYAGRLLALCLRYAGDRATAEDLLHDAFLKIYGAFSKFEYRGAGSLRAWMERVTVNVALEWLRTRNRLGCVELDEGRAAALPDEPSAEEASRVPRDVLMRFVSELPDGYRAVFNLYCIEEYSHREIAQMLGINEKSSSSQLFRAADAAGAANPRLFEDTLSYETG